MSTLKAFKLSAVYVLGMSINYALIGVLAAVVGSHFQAFFQAPIFLITFSALFALLALSLFGLYELQLPNGLHQKINNWSNRHEGGTYFSVGVMGFLSTLVVSPCVTAPLVGALSYIGRTGDVMLGATALFVMGIGMGIPLMAFGTSEGKLLPKTGPWMKDVKAGFGFIMLLVSIDLLYRILAYKIIVLLVAAWLTGLGIYLIRFSGISHHRHKIWRFLGLIPLIYAILVFFNCLFGIYSLKPFGFLFAPQTTMEQMAEAPIHFKTVTSINHLAAEIKQAQQEKKWVILDFSAKWCVACQELDHTVFSDDQVKSLLKSVVLLRVDLTDNTNAQQLLQDKFSVVAPPTILFFSPTGEEQKNLRIVGEIDVDDFIQHIRPLA